MNRSFIIEKMSESMSDTLSNLFIAFSESGMAMNLQNMRIFLREYKFPDEDYDKLDKLFKEILFILADDIDNKLENVAFDTDDILLNIDINISLDDLISKIKDFSGSIILRHEDAVLLLAKVHERMNSVVCLLTDNCEHWMSNIEKNIKYLRNDIQRQNELSAKIKTMKEFLEHSCESEMSNGFIDILSDMQADIDYRMNGHDKVIDRNDSIRAELHKKVEQIHENKSIIERYKKEIEKYKLEASTDDLTTMLNRRTFVINIKDAHNKFKESKIPYSLIMCDIDRFKDVNDMFGHNIGDSAIQHVAEIIKNSIRDDDSAYRYGGEEFAILLPETSTEQAGIVASRIYRVLNAKKLNDEDIKITCSFGIASADEKKTFSEVIEEADRKLYISKKTGRNKIT